MPSIASLGVSVYARTGQFDKAMRRASRTIGKFGASLRRFSGYASVIAGGGLGVLAVKSFEAIDAQAKLSDQLGFQQEKLAGLQHAAQLAGVSTESISKALGLLGKNVVDAANGTGEASDSFKALGLDAKELVRLPVAEQFNQITNRR